MEPASAISPPDATTTVIETTITGQAILEHPLLNKGSAFTQAEREALGLVGLLPPHVATMDEQLARDYEHYQGKTTNLERYIYLASLHDRNETLFYRLVQEHIHEMAPIIYTPVVGEACQRYSHIFRRPRGIYIAYEDRHRLDQILSNPVIQQTQVAVVTDGERILGLGDQGIDGMGIPVGKLALYTLCAGIHPATTLPIVLDVGTNNQAKLDDPLYLGWHHERIRGGAYDEFIDAFVHAFKRHFPHALLQWEDFSKQNAKHLLERYRHAICTFNDDIQGTGAVTLAGLISALKLTRGRLSDQRIVIYGAGSAGLGIGSQIAAAMVAEGTPREMAIRQIWLLNSRGLVHTNMPNIEKEQAIFARPVAEVVALDLDPAQPIALDAVVAQVHPTILIGATAKSGSFTEAIVREMTAHTASPIIFALSNPTAQSEATPEDLIHWTDGRAIVATGSPFDDVEYHGLTFPSSQCNNMYIFPGVGLGILASRAATVTDEMFLAAASALSELAPASREGAAALYPDLADIRAISRHIATAVARAAMAAQVAKPQDEQALAQRLQSLMWEPRYATITVRSPVRHWIFPLGHQE
jgi:malate dehydrogenase (oxaloacetate-decarboxylating)